MDVYQVRYLRTIPYGPYGISRLGNPIYDFMTIIVFSGQNEYLLLSGSARDGTVDLEIQTPSPSPEPGKGSSNDP